MTQPDFTEKGIPMNRNSIHSIDFPRSLSNLSIQRNAMFGENVHNVHRPSQNHLPFGDRKRLSTGSWKFFRRLISTLSIFVGIAACVAAPLSISAEEPSTPAKEATVAPVSSPNHPLPLTQETLQNVENSIWNITGPSHIFVGHTASFQITLPPSNDGKILSEPILRLRLSKGLELVESDSSSLSADVTTAKSAKSSLSQQPSQPPRYWYRELTESEALRATQRTSTSENTVTETSTPETNASENIASTTVATVSTESAFEPLSMEIRVLQAGSHMVEILLESETLPVAARQIVIHGVEPLNPLPSSTKVHPSAEIRPSTQSSSTGASSTEVSSTGAKSAKDSELATRSTWTVDPFAQKIYEQTSSAHTLFSESAERTAERSSAESNAAKNSSTETPSTVPSASGGDASSTLPPINLDEIAKTLGPDGHGPGLDSPRSADPTTETFDPTGESDSNREAATVNPTNETESNLTESTDTESTNVESVGTESNATEPTSTTGTSGENPWTAADAQKKETELGDPLVDSMESLIRLRPDEPVWIERIDDKPTQVIVQGEICNRDCMLELFAGLGRHGKDHEAIVRCPVLASTVHAALLVCGAQNGTPASWEPEYTPATGTVIEITVFWKDADGKIQQCLAQEWIRTMKTKETMKYEWVFAGSQFVENPYTGKVSYGADRDEEFICVSNFPYATLDLPVPSTRDNASLEFEAWTERIPPLHTPITLRLRPKLEP